MVPMFPTRQRTQAAGEHPRPLPPRLDFLLMVAAGEMRQQLTLHPRGTTYQLVAEAWEVAAEAARSHGAASVVAHAVAAASRTSSAVAASDSPRWRLL